MHFHRKESWQLMSINRPAPTAGVFKSFCVCACVFAMNQWLTSSMGGSGLTDFPPLPSVVSVRWNSAASHLVLSNPMEPMLENWPITGQASSFGTGLVCSFNSCGEVGVDEMERWWVGGSWGCEEREKKHICYSVSLQWQTHWLIGSGCCD